MWLAYERHADRDGIAFPDGRTLARMIGHSTDNHVADLRRSLVSKGLLEVVEVGGGRGRPTKVRVLIPPDETASENLPNNGSVYEDENPPENPPELEDKPSQIGTETLPNSEINPPKNGQKPSQIRRAYKEELPELPKNCLNTFPPAGARDGLFPKPSQGDPDRTNPDDPDWAIALLDGWELSGIAPHLNTPAFRRAWAEWVVNRREQCVGQGRAPPTAIEVRKQLAHLAAMPLDRAMAAIEYSLRNGYVGIHENERKNGHAGSKPKPSDRTLREGLTL